MQKDTTKDTKKKSSKASSGKKTTKRKKAKVIVPKMTNTFKPKEMSLEEWQIALRKQQAEKEEFLISQVDERFSPGVYRVSNLKSGNDYKVVYRGKDSYWNFCSCLDFKTSQLGTCKHVEAVKLWTKAKHKKIYRDEPSYTSVYMDYNGPRRVRIRIGVDHQEQYEALARKYFDEDFVMLEGSYDKFAAFMEQAKRIDEGFRCYNDALDYIIEQREKSKRNQMMEEKYDDNTLDRLLSVSLYPYQKEGIRFAVKAGKAIIADEMGLGKTIQAIASAEIYLKEGLADSVLVVCPTSLKYQWKKEIEKFTGGDTIDCQEKYIEDGRVCPKVIVIEGSQAKRAQLYRTKAPFKIVSYHAMTNDVRLHHSLKTDVLIMDEIQRLKNWNTHIAKAARCIDSRYSVLLSGTPLENKLEELYSTMELADQFCFGPYYLFRDKHIVLNPETGAIVGYQNLNAIGQQASSRLIRRTKKSVALQLPKRSDQYIIVPMTEEQQAVHAECKEMVARIIQKYKTYHFLSEQDRQRLMLLLGKMRMVSDTTYILDQDLKHRHDVKIAEVLNLLENIIENGDEKVVIFSEWERMTRLVAMELEKKGIRYEYLHGGIPSKQRGQLVEDFITLPESRVFLSTDAGSTGLNLQVASTLINLDLPWNPAILEQRIARIYRLGQQQPVQIINLVSKDSIEEGMIAKLRFKTSMFEGVLDGGDDAVFVNEDKFKKFMEDLNGVMESTPEPAEDLEESADETDSTEEVMSEQETAEDTQEVQSQEVQGPEEVIQADNTLDVQDQDDASEETPTKPTEEMGNESSDSAQTVSSESEKANNEAQQSSPQQLISQGVSFFCGLVETLKSPEATKQLIDNIVEVDDTTGQTNIKIPVASKETVASVFQLFGKLLGGMK